MRSSLSKYRKRLSLRQLLSYYKVSMTISVMSILYGISLMTVNTAVRVLESPLRELIAALMIIAGAGKLVALVFHKNRMRGWFLVMLGVLWSLVTYVYFINDVLSRDWILSGGIVSHIFISLSRGDFNSNE